MRTATRGWAGVGAILGIGAILLCSTPASATMGFIQRPISDFVGAQGSTNLFIPPVPDYIGWFDNPPHEFASVDYAGLASGWLLANGGPDLGTETSGTVVERPLSDGRALVTVILHTTNANSFAVPFDADFATGPLLFGYRAQDILANPTLTPALSVSQFRVDFKNTAVGAGLPDLVDAFILGNAVPGQELRFLSFRSNGSGPLHAEFGVPEGTPGSMIVTQTGLFMTQFQGATGDGFPAERVDLHPLGP